MSFVGTRPEVVKYVKKYKPEYLASFLLRIRKEVPRGKECFIRVLPNLLDFSISH